MRKLIFLLVCASLNVGNAQLRLQANIDPTTRGYYVQLLSSTNEWIGGSTTNTMTKADANSLLNLVRDACTNISGLYAECDTRSGQKQYCLSSDFKTVYVNGTTSIASFLRSKAVRAGENPNQVAVTVLRTITSKSQFEIQVDKAKLAVRQSLNGFENIRKGLTKQNEALRSANTGIKNTVQGKYTPLDDCWQSGGAGYDPYATAMSWDYYGDVDNGCLYALLNLYRIRNQYCFQQEMLKLLSLPDENPTPNPIEFVACGMNWTAFAAYIKDYLENAADPNAWVERDGCYYYQVGSGIDFAKICPGERGNLEDILNADKLLHQDKVIGTCNGFPLFTGTKTTNGVITIKPLVGKVVGNDLDFDMVGF